MTNKTGTFINVNVLEKYNNILPDLQTGVPPPQKNIPISWDVFVVCLMVLRRLIAGRNIGTVVKENQGSVNSLAAPAVGNARRVLNAAIERGRPRYSNLGSQLEVANLLGRNVIGTAAEVKGHNLIGNSTAD